MPIRVSKLLQSLLFPFIFYAADPDGGGGDPPEPKPKPATPAEPHQGKETFTREYVHELREENKTWRTKHAAAEKERDDAKAEAERINKESGEKVTAAEQAANDRIMRSELKAHAIKAGMVDVDGLKLADLSTIKLNDDGTLEGADDMLKALKESKPYLFGDVKNSSSPATPPSPKPGEPKNVKNLTDEEYALERKKIK